METTHIPIDQGIPQIQKKRIRRTQMPSGGKQNGHNRLAYYII